MKNLIAIVFSALATFAVSHEFRHSKLNQEVGLVKESVVHRQNPFDHHLRVCNAYPSNQPLDVIRGKAEKLTGDKPLPYKTCRDFPVQMAPGTDITFKEEGVLAGTFSISDLPDSDAILLLVIHRHDTLQNSVSFQSHIFANLMNAQVAMIDTYKGSVKAWPMIQDDSIMETARKEPLKYNRVIALNQGHYEIVLEGFNHTERARRDVIVLNRQSYVALRVGVEAEIGESFPEELVIFPNSDPSSLYVASLRKSAASQVKFTITMLGLFVSCIHSMF